MTRVILGSASKGRLGVLRHAGIDPVVLVSDVDESALVSSLDPDLPPEAVVCALATAKATDVAARLPADLASDCVVIGCDSMLYAGGELRGKPGSPAIAREQWMSMAGASGVLYTGHCVLRLAAGTVTHRESQAGSTTVHFGVPEPEELDAYIASGEPLGVAGAFTLDGLGGWFIERIEGDPSNVIGLSLPLLYQMLRNAGLSVSEFWSPATGLGPDCE